MTSLGHDLRYALRTLGRAPVFTAIALITLAVGTGANVTVFSFVNAMLFKPAPGVSDAGSLVSIYTSDYSSGPYGESSYPDFQSLQEQATVFSDMAAAGGGDIAALRTRRSVERVRATAVSGTYFSLLGLRPALGRLISPADTMAAAAPVAVIGQDLWRGAFGSDPAVVGAAVVLNGSPFTVVGVAPAGFRGLDLGSALDVWTPYVAPPASPKARGNRGLAIVARLKPGRSLSEAQTQLSGIAAQLARAYPETNLGILADPKSPRPIIAISHSRMPPGFRPQIAMIAAILMAAVGLVLLIACANIAALLISRATARTREIAIRLALGAGRWRVLRQLVTESVVLAIAGGALGLLFSLWTADVLPGFFPPEQASMLDATLDGRTLSFAIAIASVSSIMFGLAPAWQAVRRSTTSLLRGDAGRVSDSVSTTRLRRAVVAFQVAAAVVLLVTAALLVQSLANARSADLGFTTRDAIVASVELPSEDFTPEQGLAYYDSAIEAVRGVPGVVSAGLATALPLTGRERRAFRAEGYEPRPGEDRELNYNVVDTGYFDALRVPLLVGRAFDNRDRAGAAPVAIVNDVLANTYFGGQAVGKHLTDSRRNVLEIVGVVRGTRHRSPQESPLPVVFYPLAQSYRTDMSFLVKTAGDPLPVVRAVRSAIGSVDNRVPVYRVLTLATHLEEALTVERMTAVLVGTCGAMALLLATIGVYGVIAYSVVRRTREIGVRIALGARPAHVVKLVLGEGLTVTLVGLICGLAATSLAVQALSSMLYGISASDPVTYLSIPLIFAIVAIAAALGPSLRAVRVDPAAVLRQDG
jgi:putative ABC transport system permease protein